MRIMFLKLTILYSTHAHYASYSKVIWCFSYQNSLAWETYLFKKSYSV